MCFGFFFGSYFFVRMEMGFVLGEGVEKGGQMGKRAGYEECV